MKKEDAERIFKTLKEEYENYKKDFKEVRSFICPNRGNFDDDNFQKKNRFDYTKIITNRAYRAAQIFSSGMCNGLMPNDRAWAGFNKKNIDKELKEKLEAAEEIIFETLKNSNLYSILPLLFIDNKIFGHDALGVFKDYKKIVQFVLLDIGTYYYNLDVFGNVNEFGRRINLNTLDFVKEFGKADKDVNKAYDKQEYSKVWKVFHLIVPNEDNEERFTSMYWLKDDKEFLKTESLEYMPYIVSIVDRANSSNIYGNSSGIRSLGNIRMLQKIKKMIALGIEKSVKPPIAVNSDAMIEEINLLPDGITKISGNNPHAGVEQIYKGGIDLSGAAYESENIIKEITSDFDADLFIAATASPVKKTAYEASIIDAESAIRKSNLFNTYVSELCKPLLQTVFKIMYEGGLLELSAEDLAQIPYDIEYYGELSKYANITKLQNFDRLTNYLGAIANVKPDALDRFDADEMVKEYANLLDMPANIEKSDRDVKMIRAQRIQARQEANASAQAQQALNAMEQMSKTKTDAGNALSDLIAQGRQ